VWPFALSAQSGDIGRRLLANPIAKAAVDAAQEDEPRTLADQVRLCEIPAPTFKEAERGRAYAEAFRAVGLKNVRTDREGNVLGERPGQMGRPHLVMSAHLDTAFPDGTAVRVAHDAAIYRGPGIGDNCRGLAVLLAVVRALDKAKVQTVGSITFVGTVGEEGLGDLRGVRTLFRDTLAGRVDEFVSIDGGGMTITNVGVGSRRYRVTFRGPGGHSYGNFGMPNPMHALGRAIAAIADFQVPGNPRTTFSVGRVGGGTAINAIPAEAWMEVDLRSEDAAALGELVIRFQRAVDRALEEENARWPSAARLTVEKVIVGDRPVGRTPADSLPMAAAISITNALELPLAVGEGSTDANIPMSLNIPAITIEGGGTSSGVHTLQESFDVTGSWYGTQRAVLLAIALTQR
jgi:acetylornithine deacetylase/succinyl-diaminopimelate desuccinylase-like protein